MRCRSQGAKAFRALPGIVHAWPDVRLGRGRAGAGAGWSGERVRIGAGGAGQPAFLA